MPLNLKSANRKAKGDGSRTHPFQRSYEFLRAAELLGIEAGEVFSGLFIFFFSFLCRLRIRKEEA